MSIMDCRKYAYAGETDETLYSELLYSREET